MFTYLLKFSSGVVIGRNGIYFRRGQAGVQLPGGALALLHQFVTLEGNRHGNGGIYSAYIHNAQRYITLKR